MNFTEEAVLTLYCSFVVVVLVTHRYRAAYMGGEIEIIAEIYPDLSLAALTTESSTIVFISMLLASFYAFPVRCKRGMFMIATTPIIYLAFTLPMPAEKTECGKSRVCEMAVHLAALALFCSIGRSKVEVADRLEFLRRQLLEAILAWPSHVIQITDHSKQQQQKQ
jgi:CRISPR/Cas system CMR subunit Cmr4 (Cas7 group RAMP superfamily)